MHTHVNHKGDAMQVTKWCVDHAQAVICSLNLIVDTGHASPSLDVGPCYCQHYRCLHLFSSQCLHIASKSVFCLVNCQLIISTCYFLEPRLFFLSLLLTPLLGRFLRKKKGNYALQSPWWWSGGMLYGVVIFKVRHNCWLFWPECLLPGEGK